MNSITLMSENEECLYDQISAQIELEKFISLSLEMCQELTMFGSAVDDWWHCLSEDRRAYRDWSFKAFGLYVEHCPSGDKTYPCTAIQWVKDYEKRYGKLPAIWFTDKNGLFDNNQYQRYQQTGDILASWSCSPAIKKNMKQAGSEGGSYTLRGC